MTATRSPLSNGYERSEHPGIEDIVRSSDPNRVAPETSHVARGTLPECTYLALCYLNNTLPSSDRLISCWLWCSGLVMT